MTRPTNAQAFEAEGGPPSTFPPPLPPAATIAPGGLDTAAESPSAPTQPPSPGHISPVGPPIRSLLPSVELVTPAAADQEPGFIPWRCMALLLAMVSVTLFGFGVALLAADTFNGLGAVLLALGAPGLLLAAVLHAVHIRDSYHHGWSLPCVPGGVSARAMWLSYVPLVVLLVACVTVALLLNSVTHGAKYGDLEFAGTSEKFDHILRGVDPASRSALGASSGIHLLSVFVYTAVLSVAHLRLATVALESGQRVVAVICNACAPIAFVMGATYLNCHACILSQIVSRSDSSSEGIVRSATVFSYMFSIMVGLLFLAGVVLAIIIYVRCRRQCNRAASPRPIDP